MFGPGQTNAGEQELDQEEANQVSSEDREKIDAKITANSNNFLTNMMNKNPSNNTMSQEASTNGQQQLLGSGAL